MIPAKSRPTKAPSGATCWPSSAPRRPAAGRASPSSYRKPCFWISPTRSTHSASPAARSKRGGCGPGYLTATRPRPQPTAVSSSPGPAATRPPSRSPSNAEARGQLSSRDGCSLEDCPGGGPGLASPQVGESIQLVVIEDSHDRQRALSEPDRKDRGREVVEFHVLVNPRLTVVDTEPIEFFEGCLSVRERLMIVPRARSVRVEALDQRGEPVIRVASGWYARILQHEIDHLHGTLCIDRMESRSFMSVDQFQRFWSGKTIAE